MWLTASPLWRRSTRLCKRQCRKSLRDLMNMTQIDAIETQKLFTEFNLCETLHRDLTAAGFEHPTPIQAQCLGPALEGKDIIGLAQTGTGKTAAYALPIIQRVQAALELKCIVLSPTRELAFQISEVFAMLGRSTGTRVATIVGGVPMNVDFKSLRSWPNVIVATPGRLIDHLTVGRLSLETVEVMAIDEADRMHDMGFIPQIRQIMDMMPTKRQTMMFTATMDDDVEKVARKHMKDPVRVQIGVLSAPAHRAEQRLIAVGEDQKTGQLMNVLREIGNERVLIFVRTKRGVDRLGRSLLNKGFDAVRLHGDREQKDRDKAMAAFRDGSSRILIATDIAARGLDVANIACVINYDFPRHPEDYVHRIGRTARVEASGQAISLVTPADYPQVRSVAKLLGDKLPLAPDSPMLAGGSGGGGRRKSSGGSGSGSAGASAGRKPGGSRGGRRKSGGSGSSEGSRHKSSGEGRSTEARYAAPAASQPAAVNGNEAAGVAGVAGAKPKRKRSRRRKSNAAGSPSGQSQPEQ